MRQREVGGAGVTSAGFSLDVLQATTLKQPVFLLCAMIA
jgi:hypothetical protein